MACNAHKGIKLQAQLGTRVGTQRNKHWQHLVSKEQQQEPHQRHPVKTEGSRFSSALPQHQGNLQLLWESANLCSHNFCSLLLRHNQLTRSCQKSDDTQLSRTTLRRIFSWPTAHAWRVTDFNLSHSNLIVSDHLRCQSAQKGGC